MPIPYQTTGNEWYHIVAFWALVAVVVGYCAWKAWKEER